MSQTLDLTFIGDDGKPHRLHLTHFDQDVPALSVLHFMEVIGLTGPVGTMDNRYYRVPQAATLTTTTQKTLIEGKQVVA